jgi:hypothetical protein
MLEDPFSSLSFIAGPAILTNACAIMQNGATMRYNLAIAQWREFHASLTAGDARLTQQYRDPEAALALAERRVRLQLRGLSLLNAAVSLFAATTVLSLSGALLVKSGIVAAGPVGFVMFGAAGGAFALLLASTATFLRESSCARALLMLHRSFGEHATPRKAPPGAANHAA